MVRLDELSTAVRGSRWRVEDWIARGLLDAGLSPGAGRGRGRHERIWPSTQLELARRLVERRSCGEGVRLLADYVVGLWLLRDPAIPARQARRALETWSWPERRRSERVSRRFARELLSGIPPRAADLFFDPLIAALRHGRPLVLDGLEVPREDKPSPKRRDVEDAVADDLRLVAAITGREQPLLDVTAPEHARAYLDRHADLLAADPTPLFANPQALGDLAAVTRALSRSLSVGELDQARTRVPLHAASPIANPPPGGCRALLVAIGRQDTQ